MTAKLMRMGALVVAIAAIGDETFSASATQAQAQSQATMLPDVSLVAVTNRAGVSPGSLPAQGRWFLILMRAHCAPCDTLLARIQAETPAIAPRLVIVVSGSGPADVAKMMAGFAALEPSAWFADHPGALSSALQLDETPLVLAMNDRTIQWTLSGGPGTKQLRDVLTGWVIVPGE
jgi:hypothetical protein